LLVRYSGTEPVLRVMAEGDDLQKIEQVAQELAQTLGGLLN
jgi:phosphomannomutase